MNNDYEKQMNTFKKVTLSATEKTEIRDSLVHFMAAHPPVHTTSFTRFFSREKLVISPYSGISMRVTKALVFSFMGLIITGGSLTMASANSIPGELLYPVKINVKEKIEEVGKTTPKQKLAYKKQKVVTRLKEIEKLSEKKDITKEEVTIAQAVLAEHVKDYKDAVDELKKDGNADIILATGAELIPLTESVSTTTSAAATTAAADAGIVSKTTAAGAAETAHVAAVETTAPVTSAVDTKVDPTIPDVSTISDTTDQKDLKAILSNEVEKQITEIKKTVETVAQDAEKSDQVHADKDKHGDTPVNTADKDTAVIKPTEDTKDIKKDPLPADTVTPDMKKDQKQIPDTKRTTHSSTKK